ARAEYDTRRPDLRRQRHQAQAASTVGAVRGFHGAGGRKGAAARSCGRDRLAGPDVLPRHRRAGRAPGRGNVCVVEIAEATEKTYFTGRWGGSEDPFMKKFPPHLPSSLLNWSSPLSGCLPD